MQVEDPTVFCTPDFVGGQNFGNTVNTSSWHTKNIEAINEFSNWAGGWQWDICQQDYDKDLKRFVNMVLSMGGCLPTS